MTSLLRVFDALGAPWRACTALVDAEARKGAALLLLAGAGFSLTAFAGYALWLVRGVPEFAFYLGAGALALIAIVITGFAGVLIKRRISGSVLGNSFEISDEMQAAVVAGAVAAMAAKQVEPASGADPVPTSSVTD